MKQEILPMLAVTAAVLSGCHEAEPTRNPTPNTDDRKYAREVMVTNTAPYAIDLYDNPYGGGINQRSGRISPGKTAIATCIRTFGDNMSFFVYNAEEVDPNPNIALGGPNGGYASLFAPYGIVESPYDGIQQFNPGRMLLSELADCTQDTGYLQYK